ncbi:FIG056164: rhomboid family serine protease [hydrothermal vent metagenome]|uniref:FIG056164: rhomboid family serine protease n=1 Tax=hydrothermal vent metagenome TaxID=652676 RepID=A0A1W1BEY4_9ZZZZ
MPSDLMRFKITYTIIAINLVFYIISILHTGEIVDIPARGLVDLGAIFGPQVVLGGDWWRLVTAMFLHGGMTHILMNMFSLYIIGRPIEINFSPMHYITIYLITGILGGLTSIYFHPVTVAIGASGAIFGIFGALAGELLVFRENLGRNGQAILKDFGIIIGINILIGLSIPNIDMSAHAGGLLSGLVGGFVVAKYPRKFWMFIVGSIFVMLASYLYLPSIYEKIGASLGA